MRESGEHDCLDRAEWCLGIAWQVVVDRFEVVLFAVCGDRAVTLVDDDELGVVIDRRPID